MCILPINTLFGSEPIAGPRSRGLNKFGKCLFSSRIQVSSLEVEAAATSVENRGQSFERRHFFLNVCNTLDDDDASLMLRVMIVRVVDQ